MLFKRIEDIKFATSSLDYNTVFEKLFLTNLSQYFQKSGILTGHGDYGSLCVNYLSQSAGLFIDPCGIILVDSPRSKKQNKLFVEFLEELDLDWCF